MQSRKSLSYLIAAPLVALVIAAPAAPAMPIQDARQADMYSSTVEKPKPTTQEDLRGEAVADPKPEPATQSDLRGEAVAEPKPVPAPPVGLPTWPRNPEVIPPLAQEPVAVSDDGDGIDIGWPVSILALAGAALLGGTLGIAGARRTRTVG